MGLFDLALILLISLYGLLLLFNMAKGGKSAAISCVYAMASEITPGVLNSFEKRAFSAETIAVELFHLQSKGYVLIQKIDAIFRVTKLKPSNETLPKQLRDLMAMLFESSIQFNFVPEQQSQIRAIFNSMQFCYQGQNASYYELRKLRLFMVGLFVSAIILLPCIAVLSQKIVLAERIGIALLTVATFYLIKGHVLNSLSRKLLNYATHHSVLYLIVVSIVFHELNHDNVSYFLSMLALLIALDLSVFSFERLNQSGRDFQRKLASYKEYLLADEERYEHADESQLKQIYLQKAPFVLAIGQQDKLIATFNDHCRFEEDALFYEKYAERFYEFVDCVNELYYSEYFPEMTLSVS